MYYAGAACNDKVLRGQLSSFAVLLDLDGVLVDKRGKPFHVLYAILFKEHADAAALRFYDFFNACLYCFEIRLDLALKLNAHILGMLEFIKRFNGGDPSFRRYAAPV